MLASINGKTQQLPAGTTIKMLLAQLGFDCDGVAVAVDRHVIPKGEHQEFLLRDGCQIEVIRAVGGG